MTVQVCPVRDIECTRGCERICRLDVNSKTPPIRGRWSRLRSRVRQSPWLPWWLTFIGGFLLGLGMNPIFGL